MSALRQKCSGNIFSKDMKERELINCFTTLQHITGTELVQCDEERMMRSFLFQREEEEHVTAKNSEQAEPPTCTKNRTHFPTSSQFCNLRLHNVTLIINMISCQVAK